MSDRFPGQSRSAARYCIGPQEHAELMDEEASPKRLKEMEEFEQMLANYEFPTKPITVKLTMTEDWRASRPI